MNETPESEYFDVYDADGRSLGYAKERGEVHRDGDWHRSANVWIFTGDRRLLLQRRAPDKDTWPGRLDSSIGGHYRAGEDVTAVVREAYEELGIEIAVSELISLGVRAVESREPGIADRELQDIYLLRRDLPLAAYTPDPVEIDGLTLLDAWTAVRLHRGEIYSPAGDFLPRGGTSFLRRFGPHDVIPDRGSYIAAVARAVDDVLAGQAPRQLSE